MRVVLLLLAALSMIGCAGRPTPVATLATSTNVQQTATNREAVKDSSSVRDALTFRPVTVAADSAAITVQLESTATGGVKPVAVQAVGKRSAASVIVKPTGQLSVLCRCSAWRDSVATLTRTVTHLRSQAGQHVRTEYRDRWHDRRVVVKEPVPRPVAWWDWAARAGAVAMLLSLLLLLILWVVYRRRNRQLQHSPSHD